MSATVCLSWALATCAAAHPCCSALGLPSACEHCRLAGRGFSLDLRSWRPPSPAPPPSPTPPSPPARPAPLPLRYRSHHPHAAGYPCKGSRRLKVSSWMLSLSSSEVPSEFLGAWLAAAASRTSPCPWQTRWIMLALRTSKCVCVRVCARALCVCVCARYMHVI